MSAETEHDEHSSFIKTPQQLIVILLLAFLVPVFGIVLVVQLVIGKPSADPNALTPESVAARLQPVGHVEFAAAAGGAGGGRSGEQMFKSVCSACHQSGVAGAPKLGDKAAWAPRVKQGLKGLLASATQGKGAMPPKGGDASASEDELARAIVYMANQAGAKFKEPAASKAAAAAPQQAGAAPQAAADGKKVFDSVCTACHSAGVAGAPKLGDKAAWAPRVKTGIDALVQSATKGKGAMPPKGGNSALTDAEIRAAVEFMISQAK
jgi:cytochrome c5